MRLSASIILEISPPDAILVRGIKGSPGFVEIRNSIESYPRGPISARLEISILKSEFAKSNARSSSLIAFSSTVATSCLSSLTLSA